LYIETYIGSFCQGAGTAKRAGPRISIVVPFLDCLGICGSVVLVKIFCEKEYKKFYMKNVKILFCNDFLFK
jgi:hypothetical protein